VIRVSFSPFLLLCGGLVVLWSSLFLSGLISMRAATRRKRFWFALRPLLLGLVCVLVEIPISVESQGSRLNFDLRWLFIIPLLFGIAALTLGWKTRRAA
jgi:hypothetical protein